MNPYQAMYDASWIAYRNAGPVYSAITKEYTRDPEFDAIRALYKAIESKWEEWEDNNDV